jgi:hypothetical protein
VKTNALRYLKKTNLQIILLVSPSRASCAPAQAMYFPPEAVARRPFLIILHSDAKYFKFMDGAYRDRCICEDFAVFCHSLTPIFTPLPNRRGVNNITTYLKSPFW